MDSSEQTKVCQGLQYFGIDQDVKDPKKDLGRKDLMTTADQSKDGHLWRSSQIQTSMGLAPLATETASEMTGAIARIDEHPRSTHSKQQNARSHKKAA